METIQMKKQLLAVAVASAFASTAFAANVTVYGSVDTGLVYTNQSFGGVLAGDQKDVNKFSMDSSVFGSSKFGFKGTEDLGDGYSVSFQLENGFKSDSGELKTKNTIFDREARLSLNTPYGTASFGRMGSLTSGAGTYDVFQNAGDAADGGYADYIGAGYWFTRERYNNMVTLVTPEANGFTGYAQYSFAMDSQEDASVRNNNRYAALGLTYSAGALNVAVVADTVLFNNATFGDESKVDDAKAFSLGVNYDFGVTKAFFGAQYGKNEKVDFSAVTGGEDVFAFVKGYNLHIGTVTPLPCGTLTVTTYYSDYEDVEDNSYTAKKYGIGLMHEYALSKRTTLYTGAGFAQTEIKYDDGENKAAGRMKGVNVTVGLSHTF